MSQVRVSRLRWGADFPVSACEGLSRHNPAERHQKPHRKFLAPVCRLRLLVARESGGGGGAGVFSFGPPLRTATPCTEPLKAVALAACGPPMAYLWPIYTHSHTSNSAGALCLPPAFAYRPEIWSGVCPPPCICCIGSLCSEIIPGGGRTCATGAWAVSTIATNQQVWQSKTSCSSANT
jgi:hypothetical protein